jgi:hypothetical protein
MVLKTQERESDKQRKQIFSTKRVLVLSNYIVTGTHDDESKEANTKNKCLVNKLIIKKNLFI